MVDTNRIVVSIVEFPFDYILDDRSHRVQLIHVLYIYPSAFRQANFYADAPFTK